MNILVFVLIFLILSLGFYFDWVGGPLWLGKGGKAARWRAGQPTQATPRAARAAREAGGRTEECWPPLKAAPGLGVRLGERAGGRAVWRDARGTRREHRFVSPLLKLGERLLPRPAAGACSGGSSGSSFTSLLSSPLSHRQQQRWQRWGQSGSGPKTHRGELSVETCRPKHSPKSGRLGEDFCLLGEICQASWDLWVERWPSPKRRKMLLRVSLLAE